MIKKALIITMLFSSSLMAKDMDLIDKFYQYDCKIKVERDELLDNVGDNLMDSIRKMKVYLLNQYFSNKSDIKHSFWNQIPIKNSIDKEIDTLTCNAIRDSLNNLIIKVNTKDWEKIRNVK